MANLLTLECMRHTCKAGRGGARYKTPQLEPGDAILDLDLHDRQVHGAAEAQIHQQGGRGGADTHPPHDTAVWAESDNSENKTTGHSSDTMIIVEVVLECPIPGCEEGENYDVFVTPPVSTERAVDILRLHCKREHPQQCVPQPYLVVDSSELGEKIVLRDEWLEFLRRWAVYRASVKGTREKLHYLLLDSLLAMAEIVDRKLWLSKYRNFTDLQLIKEAGLMLWCHLDDPEIEPENAVVASPVEGGVVEAMNKSARRPSRTGISGGSVPRLRKKRPSSRRLRSVKSHLQCLRGKRLSPMLVRAALSHIKLQILESCHLLGGSPALRPQSSLQVGTQQPRMKTTGQGPP